MRIEIPRFTTSEIIRIVAMANFTDRELALFNLRNKDKTLEECAETMDYSIATINRINKRMIDKIIRIL